MTCIDRGNLSRGIDEDDNAGLYFILWIGTKGVRVGGGSSDGNNNGGGSGRGYTYLTLKPMQIWQKDP